MSLRQREFTLEALEQRMLLSADGFMPELPTISDLPGLTPVDIVLVNDQAGGEENISGGTDTSVLVDTTAPVAPADTITDMTVETTQTTQTTVTTTTVAPATPSALTPTEDPQVDSAADLSVITLTSGNGPPASGTNDSVSVGDLTDDLSAWDPPLGGFNFTATHSVQATRDAQYTALTNLFTTGTSTGPVEMYGTIVTRPDGGSGSEYTFGLLSLEGTLYFQRYSISGVAQSAGGKPVFEVWFGNLTSASLVSGGLTISMTVSSGGFLLSGDLANVDTTGGLAGTLNVSAMALTGSVGNTLSFGTLTGATLSLNTTGAAATATDIGGSNTGATGIDLAFASTAKFLRLSGSTSIDLSTSSIAVSLSGTFTFEVADLNGATAGGKTITFSLTGGSASLSVTGVSLTATGINGAFLINTDGVAGWASVTGISATLGGLSFSGLSGVTVALNTTNTTVNATVGSTSIVYGATETNFVRVGGTVTMGVSQGGIAASLTGSFTFDRSVLDGVSVIRIAVASASTSFTAGTTTLGITGINGSFVIRSDGFAGKASVAGISLTGFTFTVSNLFFEINTTNTEFNNLAIPGGQTLNFMGNDRKKFFRIQGGVTMGVDLGGIAVSLDGTFYFEQYDPDGAGSAPNVVKFAAIGANASFTAGSVTLSVTGVDGGFLISSAGIAGFVTADDVDLTGITGVTLSGSSLSFAINTTGAATGAVSFGIAESGQTVSFDFSDADEQSFVSVGGTITLGLSAGGAALSITGSMAYYGGTVDGTEVVKIGFENLSASVTVGPVTTTLTNVDGIILLLDDGTNEGVAGRVTFEGLSVTGVTGFTLTATNFAFEFNTTGLEINESLTIGGVTQALDYTSAANELNFFRGSGTASLAFSTGSFSTTLTGTFGFEVYSYDPDGAGGVAASDVVKFAFTDVDFEVGFTPGSGPRLVVDNANGFFLFGEKQGGGSGYAGKLEIATASLQGVTGLTFTVQAFSLETNTLGKDVNASITRPSGPAFTLSFSGATRQNFIALGGTLNFSVSLGGFTATLSGGFYFERATLDLNGATAGGNTDIMKVSVSGASFSMNVGGSGGVTLAASQINGAFLIESNGKSAGRLSIGHLGLTGISGFNFTVTDFALAFNNTGGAVSANIPVAGDADGVDLDFTAATQYDFIQVAGTLNLSLTVGSFTAAVSGSFFFEQGSGKIKVGLQNASMTVAAGAISLNITNVNGLFVLYPDDAIASDVDTDGELAMKLSIGAMTVTGINGLTFGVTNFFLEINNTGGAVSETFTLPDGSDADTNPDVATLSFTADILKLGGTVNLGLTVGSFTASVNGSFMFEQGSGKILVGLQNAGMTVAAGSIALNITNVNGLFAIYEDTAADADTDGTLAMKLSIGGMTITGINGLTFGVSNFFLELNNTGGAVSETFTLPDGSDADTNPDVVTLSYSADILKLGGTVNLGLTVGSFTASVNGSFMFEQGSGKVLVGIYNAGMTVAAGSVALNITNVNGLFAIYQDTAADADTDGTLAMKLSVGGMTVTGISGLTFGVSNFFLELNNTGGAVSETFTLPDGSDADTNPDVATLSYSADILKLGGTVNLGLTVGSFTASVNGSFMFEQGSGKILVGLQNAGMTVAAGSVALNITNVNGLFAIYQDTAADADTDGTLAMKLSIGGMSITGISGLTFGVSNFFLEINNTGGAVSETFTLPDGSDADSNPDVVTLSFSADILKLGGTVNLGLTVGSFTAAVNGSFMFEQGSGKIKVGLYNAGMTVAAGSIALNITNVNGLFAIYEDTAADADTDGTLAMKLSVGGMTITGINGLTFGVSNFFLEINNTGGSVSESFTLPDGSDADTNPDVATLSFSADILKLGGTVNLGLTVGSFTAAVNGSFMFEQGSGKVLVGIQNAGMTVAVGSVALNITNVNGLFAIYQDTAADADTDGTLAMKLSIGGMTITGISGLTFGVSNFFLEINNTGGAVSETFTLPDGSDADTNPDVVTLSFSQDILSLGGTVNLGVTVGSFSGSVNGSFSFEQTASKMKIAIQNAGINLTVGVVQFTMTQINGLFVVYPDDADADTDGTLAMSLQIGSVSLTGIPGVSLSVTNFFLQINTAGDIAAETFTVPDGPDAGSAPDTLTMDYDTNLVRLGGNLVVKIGGTPSAPYLTLTATGVVVDTSATGSGHVFEAAVLSGSLNIPALGTITVSASNLAVTADGHLANRTLTAPFVVEVTFGGGGPNAPNASSFNWPTWLPIEISHLALVWSDVGAHPDEFILVLSASIKPIAGLPLTFSGMVDNLRLDVGKLIAGEFPILGFDAAAVQISGNLFGMTVSGGVIIGMIDFDSSNHIIDRSNPANLTTPAAGTIFYFGIRASINIAGVGGASFSLGLADIDPTDGIQIVPLEAMISVSAPIIIEPISGLTLGSFFARVQFASTLESSHYENLANLKAVSISSVLNPTLATWEAGLKESTLSIYLSAANAPNTPVDVFSRPMVITAAVTMYSSYISQQALNGTMLVKFDTEGRILLIGELLFGGGNMKMDAKLYADLTNTAGGVSFSFYASYGTPLAGQKPFEIEGSLQIRLLDATRTELTASSHVGATFVQFKLSGSVTFTTGGMIVKAAGSVFIEVDYSNPATSVVKLVFAASISVVAPTPNPLGANFATLAGSVVIFVTGSDFEMYGAVKLTFTPASLRQFGIDISATAFLQINTLGTTKDVTLTYLNGTTETVTIRENSFSIYLKGDLTIGPPNSAPSAAFLKMNGFVIIELNSDGLTFVFDVDLQLAPGGTRLLTLDATGFMRINNSGIAARLDLALTADFPPSSGLDFDANFLLIINTTKSIVTYDIPDFVLTGAPGEVTSVTIAQAAPTIGPIGPGKLTTAAGGASQAGADYYIIAATGKLTALSIELTGDFFVLITADQVQLQVNATATFGSLGTLSIHGFLQASSSGAAGLLEITTTLSVPGISITNASFVLAFNTYSTQYTLSDGVADQFSLPHGSKLAANLIRIEISGTVTVASTLVMSGRFFFEQAGGTTTLSVDATIDMPVIGTLLVDGDLVIYDSASGHQGVLGSLTISVSSGNRSALAAVGITFSATLRVKVNSTNVALDDPGIAGTTDLIAANTIEVDLSGSLTVLNTFTFNGHFYFRKSGSNLEVRFDATLNITVGTFTVTGTFNSTSAGFTAQLSLSLQSTPTLASMGFKIHGDFLLAINTTNSGFALSGLTGNLVSFNGQTLAADTLKIYVKGGVTILDTLELTGSFELTQGSGFLELKVTATISLDGLASLSVNGFAGIYSDGIVLSVDVTADFGISGLFDASGLLEFRLNTTGSTHNGITADYFRIHVGNLTLRLLSVLTITGSLDFTYSAGTFTLSVSAGIDFFGLGSINASGYFDSDGNYSLDFHGHVGIGVDGFFGIFGDITFHIDGSNESILHLSGSISGTAYLVGIGFGVNVGINWDAASGRLRASVSITIDFFFFSVSFGGDFDLGYIKSTVTYQAGDLNNGQTWSGGALYVNVGARASSRNYSGGDINEQVFIRQGTDGRIEVELFGKKKKYDNVTSVHVDLGEGNNFVYVDSTVTVPVFITSGSGIDVIQHNGSGVGTIDGGAGNDVIDGGSGNDIITGGLGDDILRGNGGNDTITGGDGNDIIIGGTGVDILNGNNGNDNFVWTVGDGDDSTINGGANTDTYTITGTNGAELLTISPNGSNFDAAIAGVTLNTVGFESLVADLQDGDDSITINHLASSTLTSVDLSLGTGGSDVVTINGNNSGTDLFRLTTNSTVISVARVATLSSLTSLVDYTIHEGTYPTDRLVINGNGGDDTIDATHVVNALMALTLDGGAGNDTLVGSSFADTINGGTGDDILTGGPGIDTFTDTSGTDTLIETMDRNFTLNGWTLNAGGAEAEALPHVFETIRLNGGNSGNTFTISNVATVIWLNGGEGDDIYLITIAGSGTSTVNVADAGTGVGFSNTNTLKIYGTDDADVFLFRAGRIQVGDLSAHNELITVAGLSAMEVHGGDGADSFIVDETTIATTLYGEDGEDSFTVGRILAAEGQPAPTGITTIDTTRGFLSYGNKAALDIYGGNQNDYFEINHNQAGLHLYGESGDDLFFIRTFLEEGSALSNVNGGTGNNTIRYVQNGPVFIDGGDGFDRIVLEGTEADDVFIITDTQIFGGGRRIDFTGIEGIVILGGQGNDTFWILGNGLPLEIQGGSGNDTVHLGGQAPDYVYDAPPIIIDPPAYSVWTPVFTAPVTVTVTIPAHFYFGGDFPWFHWVSEQTFSFTIPPIFIGFQETIIDPPPYTYDPNPITYHFANVTNFNGVINGIEVYESANATPVVPGPGVTPTSRTNLGTIAAPVKIVGGDDTGVANENDQLLVHLGSTSANLTGTMSVTDESSVDDHGVTTLTPIGQLLGFNLPNSFTNQGHTFLGGITYRGLESATFDLGSGNDTFNILNTFDGINVTVNGNGGNDTFNVQATTGALVLNGGDGNDTFNLGSGAPTMTAGNVDGIQGAVTINGGNNTDSLNLDDRGDTSANTFTLTSTTITGLDMAAAGITYSGIDSILVGFGSGADTVYVRSIGVATTLQLNGGNDTLYVSSASGATPTGGNVNGIAAALTVDGGTGGATLTLDDTGDSASNTGTLTNTTITGLGLASTITYSNFSILNINLGSGDDFFTFDSTHTAATNLNTGAGADQVRIRTISGATSVSTAAGNDIVRVGTLAPSTGGTLNSIGGLLTLDGGSETDQLWLDETGDTGTNSGTLGATSVRGLGMSQGIDYSNFDSFNLGLGSGQDTLAITGTHAGTTVVDGNDGNDTFTISGSTGTLTVNGGNHNDTFNVQAIGSATFLDTGAGTNTINVGSAAPATGGNVNAINGKLTITGAGTDTLNVDDTGDSSANTGTLTGSTLTGLGMAGNDASKGIDYTSIETLVINLGSGGDTFTIVSTHANPTTLNTGGGDDRVNIRTISGLTNVNLEANGGRIYVGTNAGLGDTGGNVNSIATTLTINGGSGTAVLNIDDTGDTLANTGTLTGTTLTGLGLGTNITYAALTTLNIFLGSGGDTFTFQSTHAGATNLSTNNGNDTVNVRATSGATSIDTGAGTNTVNVGSTAPTAGGNLNAIGGLLTITGGGTDTVNVDDTGDSAVNTGNLTGTALTGLGMGAGINYGSVEVLNINLGSGADVFTITSTHAATTNLNLGLGADTLDIVSIAGLTNVAGNAGADIITVNPAHVVGTNPIGAVLNLDGNDGGDQYIIKLTGAGSSVINVLDTGTTGVDNLLINDTPGQDTFLFRTDFVVLLQFIGGVQQAGSERINYTAAIDGMMTLTSVGGANHYYFDDNSANTTINGSNDGDSLQVGQIYGLSFVGAGFAVGDLIETTRGLLTHGISRALTFNGGTGEDFMQVYHNRAALNLNGGDGDDTFVVRSFALVGSTEGAESYDPLRGSTNVSTGGGTNHVAYAVNAPVTIAGGGGFNTLVIIGTEFADNFIITENGVYGAGLFVQFTGIQQLLIYLAEGNDHAWVLGTPAGTSVQIVGGQGSDTIHLGGQADPVTYATVDANGVVTGTATQTFALVTTFANFHGPLFIDGGIGGGVPPVAPGIGLFGEATGPLPSVGNANVFVVETDQVDSIIANNTGSTGTVAGFLTSDRLYGLGLVGDTVIAGNSFLAGVRYTDLEEIVVQLGSGDDDFTVLSTHTGRTVIEGRNGNDTINVRSVSGHTTILGGNGNDTINVGSLAPGTGGNLDGIDALLAIDGGANTDTVNVDQRGNSAGSTGWLTQTTLTGLEMTSGLATVNDTVSFRVNATSGTYTLSYGSAAPETLAWNATADDLTAALWRLLGNRNASAQQLGGEFIINFQGLLHSQAVNLGITGNVTVAHRIAGVNYYGTETLNLDLGSGADVMNVRGTTAVTNLNTRDGNDRVYVSSAADLTTATTTDFLRGNLDAITGTLNINAGLGRNLLMVSDEAATAGDGAVLLTSSLIRGLAPADITYQAAAAGDFTQGITVWTGSGADTINVTSTDNRAGVRTITTLNTGAGNDRVTVGLSAASDGFFVLNTQEGADDVDGTASSLSLVIFGGDGSDTLRGGSGADLIFGDNGRVNYLNGSTVVAVLGGGGPGDSTDGVIRDTFTLFTVDSSIGAGDFIYGNDGNDIILGGAGGDTIDAGEHDNIVFGDHGQVVVTAGLPVSLDSLHTGGGNDTITAGAGRDLILGGTGADTITAGAGDNVVLGDHGTILLSANVVTSATSAVNADGGIDTITTLGGRDFILGGEGGDTIDAGEGDNAVAGDHGTFTITSTTAFSFTSASVTVGGADTITTGAGADTIIGGAGADAINGGNGRNLVFGDHGTLTRDTAAGSITATSTSESTGGVDTITTGLDADVILGGAAGDTIVSGAGDDIVFGDAGTVTISGNLPVTLATTTPNTGDNDNIQAGAGADVILGGDGADTIDAGDGRNLVFGDHGTIDWSGALLLSASTTAAGVGGADVITTGADDDIVFGGTAGDTITTNAGHDVVFGDQVGSSRVDLQACKLEYSIVSPK